MLRKIPLFTFITLSLFLIGCTKGCTTSKTVASESITISTSSGDVEIWGKAKTYTNSKNRKRSGSSGKSPSSATVFYDLKFGSFKEYEIYSEHLVDPVDENLSLRLKSWKVAVSKDKNHIALGIDGKVVELIHLYKSKRLQFSDSTLVADGTMDWANLRINSYPSPESILTDILKNRCPISEEDEEMMRSFCDSKKMSDSIFITILNNWELCSFSMDYLTETKIKKLSKNTEWKKKAEEKMLYLLKTYSYSREFDQIVDFVLALNSAEVIAVLDEQLFNASDRWGSSDNRDAMSKRLKLKSHSVNEELRQSLLSEAKEGFDEFEQTGKSNWNLVASKCLKLLSASGDTTTGFEFLKSSFGPNVNRFNMRDFLEVVYNDLTIYTDYQQEFIMRKTEGLFKYLDDDSRSTCFNAIYSVVDCSMLKRLIKRYPKSLNDNRKRIKC